MLTTKHANCVVVVALLDVVDEKKFEAAAAAGAGPLGDCGGVGCLLLRCRIKVNCRCRSNVYYKCSTHITPASSALNRDFPSSDFNFERSG